MGQRILALLAAAGLIVAAVALRAAIDDGGDGGDGGGRRVVTGAHLLCDAALGDACGDTDRVAAGETGEALLEAGSAEPWLTLGPWPAMVDDTRDLSGEAPLFGSEPAVAHTRLVAVAKKGTLACGGEVTWRCVGDAAGDGIGSPPPTASDGLMLRAALVGGFLGTADYGINDIEENTELRAWLSRVDRSSEDVRERGVVSLERWVVQSLVNANVFLATEADANRLVRGSRVEGQLDIVTPTPVVTVPVVLGLPARTEADSTAIRDRLTDAGFSPGSVKGATGLPSPDVLLALRKLVP